jgi:NSS family neurotransmitter:Na+ symporter
VTTTERWSSRLGFILAGVGSAVGIGNIWRFSSVLGQNGGGAYLLPYLIAVFGFALPLMALEIAIGRRYRDGVVGAFGRWRPQARILGWVIATAVFTILSYYLVITGWTLGYFVISAAGQRVGFDEFTGGWWPVATFAVSALATGAVISLGVRGGIERLSRTVLPVAFVLLIGLALYATTLEGFGEGMRFVFTPDFSVLSRAEIWSAAFGQAFFSLSVGFGILLTYGRYLDERDDIVGSATIITVSDLGVALLAGLVIFPVVFTQGLEPAAGAELAFTTLPLAFSGLPAGGLLAALFFLLLMLAALTSAVSMLEVNVAAVAEATALTRRGATWVLTGLVLLAGLPSALSYSGVDLQVAGWRILDLLDETVGTVGLPLAGLVIVLVFARAMPLEWLREELRIGRRGLRRALIPLLRWVIPAVLAAVTASRLVFGLDPAAWHWLPGVEALPRGWGTVVTVAIYAALVASTLAVIWGLRRVLRR